MSADSQWIPWALIALAIVLGLSCLALAIYVGIRALWDPTYCSLVSASRSRTSFPLIKVDETTFVHEGVVTSGDGALMRRLTKFTRMLILREPHTRRICLFSASPLTTRLKKELDELGTVVQVVILNCFHYMYV